MCKKEYVYIPESLNVDELLASHPPKFKKYRLKKDKLLYVIHCINSPGYQIGEMGNGFVEVSSKKLQSLVEDYREYLDYLLYTLKIIETDGSYIAGEKCTGYRIVKKYRTKAVAVEITNFTFKMALKRKRKKAQRSTIEVNHLEKWFHNGLQIDYTFCQSFLEAEFILKNAYEGLRDVTLVKLLGAVEKRYKCPLEQYNHGYASIEKIRAQNFHFTVDTTAARLHSNLTNMRGILRNALSYQGQPLISLDIKNSQPYLLLGLLDCGFWNATGSRNLHSAPKPANGMLKRWQGSEKKCKKDEPRRPFSIYSILKTPKFKQYNSSLMLKDILKTLENTDACEDIKRYRELVIQGRLYEYLQKHLSRYPGWEHCTKSDVKVAVFQTLFTDNRFLGQEDALPKRIFKQLFPSIYELIKLIKRKDKTLLAVLLQRIESYLMLEVIANRISIEYPDAPIFTIHDSIATTKEYLEPVKQIMLEALSKAIGVAPQLSEETWEKEKITSYLRDLQSRVQWVA